MQNGAGTAAATALDVALLDRVLAAAAAPERRDNLDWLVHPGGPPEPDPAGAGERLAALLADLEPFARAYALLVDDASRATFVNVLAQRVLGPARVILDLDPADYMLAFTDLHTGALRTPGAVPYAGTPLQWTLNRYALEVHGTAVVVVGVGLPIAQTYVLGQYAYRRDATVGPWPGDHALDIGACWGETALWLAAAVGEQGAVRAFEPAPSNRTLLEQNLAANPALAERIEVLPEVLDAVAGRRVAFPGAGAGAAARPVEEADTLRAPVLLDTETVDRMRELDGFGSVDFIKIDVEGAELAVLEGARETLLRDRPRLAIAAYHRPEDIAEIPAFLDDLGLGYRFHLQASTLCEIDLVLFATPAA